MDEDERKWTFRSRILAFEDSSFSLFLEGSI